MPTSVKKPIVIVTRKLPDVVETRMRELFDARLNVDDAPLTQAQLVESLKLADVLVPTVTDRVDRAVISQAGPQLRLIANFGTGVDNIDLDTARNRGITVTNTPGVLTEDTADMTMALILAVPRRLVEGAAYLKAAADHWGGWSPTWMLGHRIFGKRLGIIGMGRIGRRSHAAPRRSACRSTITTAAASRRTSRRSSRQPTGRASTRCCRASTSSPSTARIRPAPIICCRRGACGCLKPSAYIVNTARGEVIDENELARLIEAGAIAGAGLDVFEHEPAVNPKILSSDRVVALPHMSSATIEGRIDMGEKVIINIKAFLDGHAPPDRVHPAMF